MTTASANGKVGRPAQDIVLWKTPLEGLQRKVTSTGYITVRIRSGLWEGEHRMVLAQMLGRPLRANEAAHHRNGNRADNSPGNLELWVDQRRAMTLLPEPFWCPHCGKPLQVIVP